MRSTYSVLTDVLLFRSGNIQRSSTATEKWICFCSNWYFFENTCSANSSKNNQNLWKTNDTTDIKESTSKFWNWWCFNILKYFFFTKRIILSIIYLEERSTSFKMNYWYLWKIAEVWVHIGSAFKDCFTCIEYTC